MEILEGGVELLSKIKETWELLNEHHTEKSIFFKDRFRSFTFEKRKLALIERTKKGILYVLIAKKDNEIIGHCVSSILADQGEIETVFVKPEYRKTGLGRIFMEKSMNWFELNNISNINLMIAHGNEEVVPFYKKFGFLDAGIKLKYNKNK